MSGLLIELPGNILTHRHHSIWGGKAIAQYTAMRLSVYNVLHAAVGRHFAGKIRQPGIVQHTFRRERPEQGMVGPPVAGHTDAALCVHLADELVALVMHTSTGRPGLVLNTCWHPLSKP